MCRILSCKFTEAAECFRQKHMVESQAEWIPPRLGELKINFDAGYSAESAHTAVLVRDYDGVILHAWVEEVVASEAYMADALALKRSIRIAEDLELMTVTFEGDARGVILAVKGSTEYETWQARTLTDEAKSAIFGGNDRKWTLNNVPKSCNWEANNLVQWAKFHRAFGYVDISCLPQDVFCDQREFPSDDCNHAEEDLNV